MDRFTAGGVRVLRPGGEGQVPRHQGTESHPCHHLHPRWSLCILVSSSEEDSHARPVRSVPLHGDQLSGRITVFRPAPAVPHAQEVPARLPLPPPGASVQSAPVHLHPAGLLRCSLADSDVQAVLHPLPHHARAAGSNQEADGVCLHPARAQGPGRCFPSKQEERANGRGGRENKEH